jgi:Tfp pilus assembly protein PilV
MEVLIGIAIFAIGMLALASLQGALTRATVESKVRTEAASIAEQQIESQRGFGQLGATTGVFDYSDIVSGTRTVPSPTSSGITYTVTQTVTDYWYDTATDSYHDSSWYSPSTLPTGETPAYKAVDVTVSWDTNSKFVVDNTNEVTGADIGGGQVEMTATISSVSVAATGKILEPASTNALPAPPVDYNPGNRPDIVSLELGDNKFKESLLPEPDVIRTDELVETRFDVITYSQTDTGAVFLRREEFTDVSCDCVLHAPPGDAESAGRRPVVWAGDEYVRGQYVDKPYGTVVPHTQQSAYCDQCCRDHHDGGSSSDDSTDTAVNVYDPFKSSTEYVASGAFAGDHKHYMRANNGSLTEATSDGDTYVEACRLVRQDGFFRVAQDFRQEDLNVFPQNYLDSQDEIDVYSNYITGAVSAYVNAATGNYETSPPCINGTGCVASPPLQGSYDLAIATDANGHATQMPSWTTLPLGLEESQQLRSRGLYIDYLSEDLRNVLANCDPANGDTAASPNCQHGDVVLDRTGSVNPLELIPFFDVQLTKLNRWNESPANYPVAVTNEPVQTDNTHSRGEATKDGDGRSTVTALGNRGNLGFTDTLPIDLTYASQQSSNSIDVEAGTGSAPTGYSAYAGSLSDTVPGNPNIVVTGSGGVQCNQTTPSYVCYVPDVAGNYRIEISGYGKQNSDRYVCSVGSYLASDPSVTVTRGTNAKTVFIVGSTTTPGTDYNFVVQDSPCFIVGG